MRINSDTQIYTRLFRHLRIEEIEADLEMFLGGIAPTKTQPEMNVSPGKSEALPTNVDSESLSSPNKGAHIRFNDEVTVVTIPSHSEYSDGIKKIIWSNSEEIKQNAQRNRREFAAEGWNWKKVLEEEEMFLDKFSNEWIHPVHLGGIMDLR